MSSIYAGLALAREEFPPIHKNKVADTGKYKYAYADLQTVLEAVTPALRKNGLEIVQTVEQGYLYTVLATVAGGAADIIDSRIELPTGVTPQALGSAITYARRYAIVTMLGLVTEDDEDGSAASGVQATTKPRTRQAEVEQAEVPEGWDNAEQSLAAHNHLRDRIIALPAVYAEQCLNFRQEHGWPLSIDKFGELEAIVNLAEKVQA